MADDISKKITIGVELQADKLTEDITAVNKTIDSLLAKQQQLNTAGQQNSDTFSSISSKLNDLQKKLKDLTAQVNANAAAFNSLGKSASAASSSLNSLASAHEKHAKAASNSSAKTKELGIQVNSLASAANKQKTNTEQANSSLEKYAASVSKGAGSAENLENGISGANSSLLTQAGTVRSNKAAFDAHKLTMDHLKTSFDEIKDVSGIFGPSLKEAAEGFSTMSSGLNLVKGGLTGVGEAIKADGFGFLLDILQKIFDHFVSTTNGSNVLKGAISAIGVVVNMVKGFVDSFLDTMIKAFSHPVDTLKTLGNMIEQNLINRFKAFGVILDGIIHLDFKKMANGAIQAVTGITDATGKISSAVSVVEKGVKDAAGKVETAFKAGYQQAARHVDDHENHVKTSVAKQIGYQDKLMYKVTQVNSALGNQDKPSQDRSATAGDPPVGDSSDIPPRTPEPQANTPAATQLKDPAITADPEVEKKKADLKKIEDAAKQSEKKIADDALDILSSSIKQQSDAKIAALEKDKSAELSNTSLTSAQKLAIQNKYKQEEGAIKTKAFKEEQELSIAKAVINGAEAITKVSAQTGVLSALAIGVVVAETAAQVAKIASQKPPAYEKGGLHYTSDGRGGVLSGYSKTDNTNAYLRSGEGIIVSEAMQVPWARNLVSAINVGFGGRDFSMANPGRGYAVGGIFTDGGDANRYYNQPVNDQKNLANTIAYQMINNFPPVYVDVKDVNNQQNILAQTVNRVNL